MKISPRDERADNARQKHATTRLDPKAPRDRITFHRVIPSAAVYRFQAKDWASDYALHVSAAGPGGTGLRTGRFPAGSIKEQFHERDDCRRRFKESERPRCRRG